MVTRYSSFVINGRGAVVQGAGLVYLIFALFSLFFPSFGEIETAVMVAGSGHGVKIS